MEQLGQSILELLSKSISQVTAQHTSKPLCRRVLHLACSLQLHLVATLVRSDGPASLMLLSTAHFHYAVRTRKKPQQKAFDPIGSKALLWSNHATLCVAAGGGDCEGG